MTSETPAHRTTAAGRRSWAPFQMLRTWSKSGPDGRTTRPRSPAEKSASVASPTSPVIGSVVTWLLPSVTPTLGGVTHCRINGNSSERPAAVTGGSVRGERAPYALQSAQGRCTPLPVQQDLCLQQLSFRPRVIAEFGAEFGGHQAMPRLDSRPGLVGELGDGAVVQITGRADVIAGQFDVGQRRPGVGDRWTILDSA